MTRQLVIEPAAHDDIAIGFSWYEQRVEGLGLRFVRELDRAFDRMLAQRMRTLPLTRLPHRPTLRQMPNGGRVMASGERHVRLFRNGRNQALRIPREFELEGDEAIVRKEGDRLIIEPVRKGRLLALLASLEPVDDAFPNVDADLPPLNEAEL
jgi:antitoxin VapB